MKQHLLRSTVILGIVSLLAACGAGSTAQAPAATAGLVQTADGTAQPVLNVATATMPAPDCAADACSRLRVIDGNAEAYRFDALRRGADAGTPQS